MAASPDVRRVLTDCGVKGPNLELLATSPSITVETVQREWQEILETPGVRSRTALLVHRLGDIAGVDVGCSVKRQLCSGPSSVVGRIEPSNDQEMKHVQRLERMRGHRR